MIFLIYIILVLLVACDALSDAFIDTNKRRSHLAESANIALFFVLIYIYSISDASFWQVLVLYVCIRIYLFNIVYNLLRYLPIYYRGKTDSVWDKWVNKLPTPIYQTLLITILFFSIIFCFMFF